MISDLRSGGGLITAVNGGNNITVNTVAGVATVNVSGTTNHAVQVGNALGALTSLAIGTAGQVLTSNGAGLDPSFQGLPGFALNFDGNTGTANPAANTIIFNTVNATPIFAAAGNTLTLDFGLSNLVLGSSLPALVGGSQNSGLGDNALNAIISGISNSGFGFQSLQSVNSGSANTAIGASSGSAITTGDSNTGVGNDSLELVSSGDENTAVGNAALGLLSTASFNTAVGSGALDSLITGTSNTALGVNAGTNYTTTESSNLVLGNTGTVADNNTIRIGQQGVGLAQQDKCFIAGIIGVTVASPTTVVIDSVTGQLGVAAGGGSPIETITGNTGGAESPSAGNFNIVTSNTTAKFAGSAATETLNFNADAGFNLGIGTSYPSLTTGVSNTSLGQLALIALSSGTQNTAIGAGALTTLNTGSGNNAIGLNALRLVVNGTSNNALGINTLTGITSGARNIALGTSSGSSLVTGTESDNIYLNHVGVNGESNKIRIGTTGGGAGQQNACYIAGIDGVNVGSVAKVVTMASDQLGTATITAGTNISVTPGANTITIAALGGGAVTWSVITANQTAAVNNGYFCNKAGTLALALPAVSAVGDVIKVININTATGIQFTQAAGQQIFISSASTTLGATGTLTSSVVGDTLTLVCRTANTTWWAESFVGAWTTA